MASKNGCLICNACNHSHSPTLHGSTILSIFRLSFLMDIFFFSPPCSMKSTVTKNIFTISELKVSRINYDSLRYFAGASSATAPPTCRATMIRDCIDVHRAFAIDSIKIYPLLPSNNRESIFLRHSSLHEFTPIFFAFFSASLIICLPYCFVRTGYGIVVAPSPLWLRAANQT